jgi:hypothetical protein
MQRTHAAATNAREAQSFHCRFSSSLVLKLKDHCECRQLAESRRQE